MLVKIQRPQEFYEFFFMYPEFVAGYILDSFPELYGRSVEEMRRLLTKEEWKTILEKAEDLTVAERREYDYMDIVEELRSAGEDELADKIEKFPFAYRFVLAFLPIIYREGLSDDPDGKREFLENILNGKTEDFLSYLKEDIEVEEE